MTATHFHPKGYTLRSNQKLSQLESVEFRRMAYGLNKSQWATVLTMSKSHYSEFSKGLRALPKHAMAKAFEYGVPAEALFECKPNKSFLDITRQLAFKATP